MATYDDTVTRQQYADYINSGFLSLLSFMGLDSCEVEAKGWTVRAADGRDFIDCVGGYGAYNFGHCHPKIVSAVQEQLGKMPMSSKLLLNPLLGRLCEKLAEITPGNLSKTFISNSGTEAVEASIKLARLAMGRPGIISTSNAFHGKTLGSLATTNRLQFQEPFKPMMQGFTSVPYGDPEALEHAVTEDIAAVILEPIQGEGGIIVPPDGYLGRVREITRQKGVLLILDEIQTGFGRTGYNFACEESGVCPDIMVLAKSLGGGVMPIGATIGTPEVWEKLEENPLLHTSTFGGNELACSASIASVELLQAEDLAVKARENGRYFIDQLRQLSLEFPTMVKEVRGRGLMIGVAMQSSDISELFIASVLSQNVLIAFALNKPDVIRLEPPLIMPVGVIDEVVGKLHAALVATKEIVDQYT